MNILFTGAGRRIELIQAFRDAALTLDKRIAIYGADMDRSAPALAYCDHMRLTCAMKEPQYIESLIRICREDHIDVLIPTIDTDLLILSENRERFEGVGTRVMVSDSDKIRICRDKNNTSSFFVECGLHAPLPVNDYQAYQSGFPAFIKPKDGSSSINAFKVESQEQLEVYSKQIGDYVVQPFVRGREYTIDIFCDWDGNPLSIVPRERLQVRAGEVYKTQIFLDQTMIDEAKALCEAFKPCGPITVQLIRDEAGIDWFIEINPRYGGGAPLSMKAGARSAEYVLKLVDGEEVTCCTDVADGAIYSRFDQSICVLEETGSIRGIIFDLDDTLYSEKEYVRSGYRAVSMYLGGDYAGKLWGYFEAKKPAIDELLKELGREDEKAEVLEVYRTHQPDISLYPGVETMFESLRERGYKLGIITDGRPSGQRSKIEALKLHVDDIIITDELGGVQFRKPCDIAFRILQMRWRIPASQILYVGDNLAKDFKAPQQLGMKSAYYRNPDSIYYIEDNSQLGIGEMSAMTIGEIERIVGGGYSLLIHWRSYLGIRRAA